MAAIFGPTPHFDRSHVSGVENADAPGHGLGSGKVGREGGAPRGAVLIGAVALLLATATWTIVSNGRQAEPQVDAADPLAADRKREGARGAVPEQIVIAQKGASPMLGRDQALASEDVTEPTESLPTAEPGVRPVVSASGDQGASQPGVSGAPAASPAQPSNPSSPPVARSATEVASAPAPTPGEAAAAVPSFANAVIPSGVRQPATRDEPDKGREASARMPVTGAQLLTGRIRNSDYPRAARRSGAQGTVFVRFAVQPDGRVGDCVVTRSSGSPVLDSATCELIQLRFKYKPARDAQDRAVPDVIVGRQSWWLGRNGPPRDLLNPIERGRDETERGASSGSDSR
jgi:protein TonB